MMISTPSFDEAYSNIEKIPGWFSKDDALALWNVLQHSESKLVVEIGSFLGKSAVLISHFKNLICIDPWIAGPRLANKLDKEIKTNKTFYELFETYAIKENKFGNRITPIIDKDSNIWSNWDKGKIGVLHLDHLHTYSAVLNSLLNWRKHLDEDAIVFIHDSNLEPVMKGIVDSKIQIIKIIKKSIYQPAICMWRKPVKTYL